MAIEQVYAPYLGAGKCYIREAGTAAPLRELGNASVLKFTTEEDEKDMTDYTQPGGGVYASVKRIKSVTCALTLHDFNASNLAMAVYGSAQALATQTLVDSPATAYQGGLIPLQSPSAVTVTDAAGTTTFVAGTDYEVRKEGIYILGGAIADGTPILIDATLGAAKIIQALTSSGKTYELVFGGTNEATGKGRNAHAFRVQFGTAKELPFIGDDFGALEIEGKVLKDTSKTGAGVSQYYTISDEA